MPYKSNSNQTPRVYKKRVQPDFSSVLLTTDVSLNIPVVVPEIVVEKNVEEIVEELMPDIVEENVPDIVEEIIPDIVEEIPPPPIFSEDGTKILNYRTNRYVKVGGAIDLKFNLSKMD